MLSLKFLPPTTDWFIAHHLQLYSGIVNLWHLAAQNFMGGYACSGVLHFFLKANMKVFILLSHVEEEER